MWILTDWTLWQHWMEPVLHWLTVVAVGTAVSVTVVVGVFQATAARAREEATRRRENENIFVIEVGALLLCCGASVLRILRRTALIIYSTRRSAYPNAGVLKALGI